MQANANQVSAMASHQDEQVHLFTCKNCDGAGWLTCECCAAEGYLECELCCDLAQQTIGAEIEVGGDLQGSSRRKKKKKVGILAADGIFNCIPCNNTGYVVKRLVGIGRHGFTAKSMTANHLPIISREYCERCWGQPKACPLCVGLGRIRCPKCAGTRKERCPVCKGYPMI
jgi:hypothetical protein